MTTGQIWPDSLGQHPYAQASWIGQASWRTSDPGIVTSRPDGQLERFPRLEVLDLSVPPSLHWRACSENLRWAVARFVPWLPDSGIAIVTLAGGEDALIAVVDVAGRTDLQGLQQAGAEHRVAAAACNELDLEVCPLLPVVGVAEALAEATSKRRLSARELAEVIDNLRWVLRSPALFPMLGLSPRQLKSVTLNVCRPL